MCFCLLKFLLLCFLINSGQFERSNRVNRVMRVNDLNISYLLLIFFSHSTFVFSVRLKLVVLINALCIKLGLIAPAAAH